MNNRINTITNQQSNTDVISYVPISKEKVEEKSFEFLIDNEMTDYLFNDYIENYPFLRKPIGDLNNEETDNKEKINLLINQIKTNKNYIKNEIKKMHMYNEIKNTFSEKEIFSSMKKDNSFIEKFGGKFKEKMDKLGKNAAKAFDEIEKTNISPIAGVFLKNEVISKTELEKIISKKLNYEGNSFKLSPSDLKNPKKSIEIYGINYCLNELYKEYGNQLENGSIKAENEKISSLEKSYTQQEEVEFILTAGRQRIMDFFEQEIKNHILKTTLPEEKNEKLRIANNLHKFNLPNTDPHHISLKNYIHSNLLDELILRQSIEEIINSTHKSGNIKLYHSDIIDDLSYGYDYIAKANKDGESIKIDLATISDNTDNIHNTTLDKKFSNKKGETIDMIICFNENFKKFIKRNLFLSIMKGENIPSLTEHVKKYGAINKEKGNILSAYEYNKANGKWQISINQK